VSWCEFVMMDRVGQQGVCAYAEDGFAAWCTCRDVLEKVIASVQCTTALASITLSAPREHR
jgi:hypothetical protein